MTTITKELRGHRIVIDDEHMRFHVTGTIINDWFAEYAVAETAIAAAILKHEAQTRKRIAIVVLDEKGNRQTITGVHAGNGSILGLPKDGRFSDLDYYPNVPWIAESLKHITQLQSDIKREQGRLSSFMMRGAGTDLNGKTHADKVDSLLTMVEVKTRAASEVGSVA